MRDITFEASSSADINLALKCPHCQKPAKIQIKAVLVPEVLIDGKPLPKKCPHCGEDINDSDRASIRTLST